MPLLSAGSIATGAPVLRVCGFRQSLPTLLICFDISMLHPTAQIPDELVANVPDQIPGAFPVSSCPDCILT
ncbi:hypothetical protein CDAR_411911 [Caerostris darwini]|uniref:Uncharacterized protein n=1 Tax=Caerostris darwini TaxID=1538125 RepID=A0AAV4WFI7_9ARAC|nr:hypothetical protein CDAR_411911 [Caerostris darwini]